MMWTWTNYNDELYHHGIKGQKWGVRRYQNEDGSLTPAGEKRYGTVENFNAAREKRKENWKKAGKVALRVAATAGAIYGGHQLLKATAKNAYNVGKYHGLRDATNLVYNNSADTAASLIQNASKEAQKNWSQYLLGIKNKSLKSFVNGYAFK